MVDSVATVATRSAQLWMDATESEMGWDGPRGVTLSGFGDVFDTWASMSHLIPMEAWPSPGAPRSIAYLCGAMPDAHPATGDEDVRGVAEAVPRAGRGGAVARHAGPLRLQVGNAL